MINKILTLIFFVALFLSLFLIPIDYENVFQIASLKGYFNKYTTDYIFLILLNKFPIFKEQNLQSIRLVFISFNTLGLLGIYLLYKNFFKTLNFLANDSFMMFISSFLFLYITITLEWISIFWIFIPYILIFLFSYFNTDKAIYLFYVLLFLTLLGVFSNLVIVLSVIIVIILLTFYLRMYKNNEIIFISIVLFYILYVVFVLFYFKEYVISFSFLYRWWHIMVLFPWIIFILFSIRVFFFGSVSDTLRIKKMLIISILVFLFSYFIVGNSGYLILLWIFIVPYLSVIIYKLLFFRRRLILFHIIIISSVWIIILVYYLLNIRWDIKDLFFIIISFGFIIVGFLFSLLGDTYDNSLINSTLSIVLGIYLLFILVLYPYYEEKRGIVYSAYMLKTKGINDVLLYKANDKMRNSYYAFFGEINELYDTNELLKMDIGQVWIFTTAEGFIELDSMGYRYCNIYEYEDDYNDITYKYYLICVNE